MTTNSFEIAKGAYNLLWNKIPIQQQNAIMLMIALSQQEFPLTGSESVDCSLKTLLGVRLSIFMYSVLVNT